jgi:hypothetical protein
MLVGSSHQRRQHIGRYAALTIEADTLTQQQQRGTNDVLSGVVDEIERDVRRSLPKHPYYQVCFFCVLLCFVDCDFFFFW